jgi:hypothetical protein
MVLGLRKLLAHLRNRGGLAADVGLVGEPRPRLGSFRLRHRLLRRLEVARGAIQSRLRNDLLVEQLGLTSKVGLGKMRLDVGLFDAGRCLALSYSTPPEGNETRDWASRLASMVSLAMRAVHLMSSRIRPLLLDIAPSKWHCQTLWRR